MLRSTSAAISQITKQNARNLPSVAILGFQTVGNGLARIVAEVAHNQNSKADHSKVGEALTRLFGGKLTAVASSFKSIEKAPYTEKIDGFVSVNSEVQPYVEGMQGLRSVSSNMFMDDEEKMWVLRKTESGDLLVKSTGIEDHHDLANLLNACCSSGYSLSSEGRKHNQELAQFQGSVQGGDFIKYVSLSTGEAKVGFAVASTEEGLIVLPSDGGDEEEIPKEAVVEQYDDSELPEDQMPESESAEIGVALARGTADINFMLDYYKRVYARSPAFYAEFAKRVRSHAFM